MLGDKVFILFIIYFINWKWERGGEGKGREGIHAPFKTGKRERRGWVCDVMEGELGRKFISGFLGGGGGGFIFRNHPIPGQPQTRRLGRLLGACWMGWKRGRKGG